MKILKFLALTMLLINTQASTTQPNSQNPPSKWQRFKTGAKNFARKHKAALSAAGGVALGAGATVGGYYAHKALTKKEVSNVEMIKNKYGEIVLYLIYRMNVSETKINNAPIEDADDLGLIVFNNQLDIERRLNNGESGADIILKYLAPTTPFKPTSPLKPTS